MSHKKELLWKSSMDREGGRNDCELSVNFNDNGFTGVPVNPLSLKFTDPSWGGSELRFKSPVNALCETRRKARGP